MPSLAEIREPVAEHLARYDKFVREMLASDSQYITAICDYVLSKRGKQMRPLLALLSATLNGPVTEESYVGAALVEMVHSASLVHDDVIDEADTRRGAPSVNAVWNSRVAVIAGDYILGRTFYACMRYGNMAIINEVTRAIAEISEGELIQTEQTELLTMTENIYYGIIERKTAALISAASAVGALSAGAEPGLVEKMRLFGRYLGIAFQIKDDILDFSPSEITGKPMCGDIRERKITLPLLHILDNATPADRAAMIAKLKNAADSPADAQYLYDAVMRSDSIRYTTRQMERFRQKAMDCLAEYPPSGEKDNMEKFADFVLQRES